MAKINNETTQAQVEGLATLLVLNDEIKKLSNLRELGFFITNETHRFIPYNTAYLWKKSELSGLHLIAQSGTAEQDVHSPVNQWLKNKVQLLVDNPGDRQMKPLTANELETSATLSLWPETLPNFVLWCPLFDKFKDINGGILFFRDSPFSESEVKMLRWLIASYQYTWNVLNVTKNSDYWKKIKKKPYFIGAIIVLAIIFFFPVHLSVLGNATIVPDHPVLINAPMQGVIKAFLVSPGDIVKTNQTLVELDKTDLLSAVEIDTRNYRLTEAKLRTAVNEAFDNKDKSTEVPILQAQLTINKAQMDYSKELLAKADIKSPIDGIVIFDSKEDWIGQPVQTGERILMVADSQHVKVRINLPIADIIHLKVNDTGNLFLYGQLFAIPIRITSLGYNAKMLPNKTLAYQLEAMLLDNNNIPEIGAQGTAKLYGQRVPLFYYLIRKPIQAIRQTLGI